MSRKLALVVTDALSITADSLTTHRDGTFTARRSFFYRFGKSAEDFRARVVADLETAGLGSRVVVVSVDEKEATWPATSYWSVRFRVKPETVDGPEAAPVVRCNLSAWSSKRMA